jgi:predicted outer membrane repeat protein
MVQNITTNNSIYVDSSKGDDANNGSLIYPKRTIKAAINTTCNNGTIFIAPGQYNENNVLIDKNISLVGGNASETSVNGDNNNILNIGNVKVTIQGLNFINGKGDNGSAIINNGTLNIKDCIFQNNIATSNGGSIFSKNTLNIENTNFIGNQANLGGAILLIQCTCTITNCKFNNNKAERDGGAINNNQNTKLILINSNFKCNNAINGGGIFNTANTTILSTTFENNEAMNYGGSIYHYQGTLTVNSTFFKFNNGFKDGGAIKCYDDTNTTVTNSQFIHNFGESGGAISSQSNLIINTCQFSNNTATYGGCINSTVNLNVTNTQFINNQASTSGGAITSSGTMYIQNNRFIKGKSSQGGAIFSAGGGTIENNDFSENRAEVGGVIVNTFTGTNTVPTLIIKYNNFTMNNATMSGGVLYNTGITTLTNNNFTMNHIIDTGEKNIYGLPVTQGGAAITNTGTTLINQGNEFFHNTIYRHDDVSSGGILNTEPGKLFIRGAGNIFVDTYIHNAERSCVNIQDCTIEKNSFSNNYFVSKGNYFLSNTTIRNSEHSCEETDSYSTRIGTTHLDAPYNIVVPEGEKLEIKAEIWIHSVFGSDYIKMAAPIHFTLYNKNGICQRGTSDSDENGNAYYTINTNNLTPGVYCLQMYYKGDNNDVRGYSCFKTIDFIVEPLEFSNVTDGNLINVKKGDLFTIIRPSKDYPVGKLLGLTLVNHYQDDSGHYCYVFHADNITSTKVAFGSANELFKPHWVNVNVH